VPLAATSPENIRSDRDAVVGVRAQRFTNWLHREDLAATIYRGAGLFMMVQVAGTALSFGLNVVLARSLGVEGYGVFAYAATWLATLLVFCGLGLNTTTLRYVAAYRAQEEWALLKGFVRVSRLATTAASIATAVVLAIVATTQRDRIGVDLARTLQVTALTLPVSALLFLSSATLRSLKRVASSQFPMTIGQPLLFALAVLGARYFVAGPLTAPVAATLFLAAGLLCLAVSEGLAARALPAPVREGAMRYDFRTWRRVTLPLFLVAFFQLGLSRVDTLFLGLFAEPREVGLYSSASRMAGFLLFGISAVNAWVAPMISEMYVRRDTEQLARMVRLGTWTILGFTLPISLCFLAFGREILSVFGPDFREAYPALAILVVGQLVHSTMGIGGYLLTMTAHQRDAMVIDGLSAVVGVGLSLVLIPRLGMNGAALANAATLALRTLAVTFVAHARLGVRATVF
jgi:O-antigen/teichoic acid export membrane protein